MPTKARTLQKGAPSTLATNSILVSAFEETQTEALNDLPGVTELEMAEGKLESGSSRFPPHLLHNTRRKPSFVTRTFQIL